MTPLGEMGLKVVRISLEGELIIMVLVGLRRDIKRRKEQKKVTPVGESLLRFRFQLQKKVRERSWEAWGRREEKDKKSASKQGYRSIEKFSLLCLLLSLLVGTQSLLTTSESTATTLY
jgi:hypothetical protein